MTRQSNGGLDRARLRVLALVGPTAAGKSDLAVEVATDLDAEIVSVDSAQCYRGMDVGTDKPAAELRRRVPHHMVDVFEASQEVSVAEFRDRAREALDAIGRRRKAPLLVGGSGLYFRAVVDPLEFPPTDPGVRASVESAPALYDRLRAADPEAALRIGTGNTRRIVRALEVIELTGRTFSSFRTSWDRHDSVYDLAAAGLDVPREVLRARIDDRVDRMVGAGLVEEVRGLDLSSSARQVLGYAQILAYLDGRLSLDEAIEEIKARTRRFARRQMAWFRADPRIMWFSDSREAGEWLIDQGRQ